MTTDTPRCHEWPPPDDEDIGIDRARLYIAWIRDHAAPVLAQAEALIKAGHLHAEIHLSAATVDQLASWTLSPEMGGLCVGMCGASSWGDRLR